MKEPLQKKSLISGKMKTISFIAVLLLVLLPGLTNAASVTLGVTFGNPQSDGGACIGKGVCRTSATMDQSSIGMTSVTFLVNSVNPNVLVMRFSMSELMTKQPSMASYFMDPTGYAFDYQFTLTGATFAPLNLLPNAKVAANVQNVTQISGDMVSVYITYSHDGGN